ncbi:hypothetical protein Snoj_36470 [Streptomyces nojiriensis]|uniref:Uncharacterized protein n=1 Tax=Streptomyces nojiriensis TaxID=66374 RepID=A0ABQ3SNL8_9ACTN|nr:DUF6400 family protein [Streptomyces nojiriensis]QTI43281.1 hypothetical protein JYK04_01043 [Streptomyces nojiriensis]GGS11862.1 hypothetical protein GCM10010205_46840 [Streptomyces nojiriensis]GHI69729.1 hypothetical protein Snoj_36470 [Streptomyces nojiriensis]
MAPHDRTPPSDASGTPGASDASELVDFAVDLTSQEVLRRAQVMAALGPDWDPMEVLLGEEAAYDLLYSGLDAEQQGLYDDLVAAGVLPSRGDGSAAA